MEIKILKTDDRITGSYDNERFSITEDDECFEELEAAFEDDDMEYIEEVLERYIKTVRQKEVLERLTQEEKEKLLKNSQYILLQDDKAYLAGKDGFIKTPMSSLLVDRVLSAETNRDKDLIQTYINFWGKVAKNPNTEARENMLWFMEKNDIKITKEGYLVTYRLVDTKQKNEEYLQEDVVNILRIYSKYGEACKFITYDFLKKEAVDIEDISTFEGKTLKELHDEIVEGNVYTDNYTHKMTIKVGELVWMPRSRCDESQRSCSRGLHSASFDWLKSNSYFGNTAMIVLVNPTDVVSVPKTDNYGKMRSCSYLPIAVFKNSSNITEEDLKDFEIKDGYYSIYEKSLAEAKAYEAQGAKDDNEETVNENLYRITVVSGEFSIEMMCDSVDQINEELEKIRKINEENSK